MSSIALCVNPMSGRDVRRLAAKATNITPEAKRDIVARIAIGADAAGIKQIFYTDEPFRIASKALATLNLRAEVIPLKTPALTHDAADTDAAMAAFVRAGAAKVIVSLGGDGTNRAIVRAAFAQGFVDELNLIPLSAGTNNAFPAFAEPTIAGMTAALAAQGHLTALRRRCKIIHLRLPDGGTDIGLIDATVLEQDSTGSLLPFDCDQLRLLMLTRSDPSVAGMSSIGGLLEVVSPEDEYGLLLHIDPDKGVYNIKAPISPGLFQDIQVASVKRVACDEEIRLPDHGVLAFDGDRLYRLDRHQGAHLYIRRDGPCVLDAVSAIRHAVTQQLLSKHLIRKLV